MLDRLVKFDCPACGEPFALKDATRPADGVGRHGWLVSSPGTITACPHCHASLRFARPWLLPLAIVAFALGVTAIQLLMQPTGTWRFVYTVAVVVACVPFFVFIKRFISPVHT